MKNTENRNGLTIIRRWQVEARCGLSRTAIYNRIRNGTFPRPISLGDGKCPRVGWIESEVTAWVDGRVEKSRGKNLEHGGEA